LLTEILGIVLTHKILEPHEIGGPRLRPFQPNGKSTPDSTPRRHRVSKSQSICINKSFQKIAPIQQARVRTPNSGVRCKKWFN